MTVGVALRLLAVMVLWASCFPLITVGLDLAPHLAFAAMRAALAGLCLIALGASFRRPVPQGVRSWALVALVGFGATSLGFLGMFHAAEIVSPGPASGDIRGYTLGIAYVVLAAAGVSIGNIGIKSLTGQVDAMMAMGFQLLIGTAPLALLSMLTEDISSLAWSAGFVLVLMVLSVFGTSLAFWLWFAALEEVELTRANAFTFLVPIFGLGIGAALFEERLGWIQAAGVMLVLTCIVLVQRDARAQTRP